MCFYLLSQVVSDLLSPISELLTSCHLANADIAHVVLVGGTTKVHKSEDEMSECPCRLCSRPEVEFINVQFR
jgi:hypothetical protein